MQLCDPWLNSMAQNGGGDSCHLAGSEDKSPVVAYPKENLGGGGIAVTYPSCPVINFAIADARDPMIPPADQVPLRVPPIGWTAPLCCTYTNSLESGAKLNICATSISGLVE